ncbi:dixin-like isoform X7 [Xiphophorus couchianus]|uniref:dixin-like isoform X7 n=1 Tax=Xiphophorus couchianus TaxID=32473 RepID=UPI00101621D0|nr:dixin-like isoform X7 [Xiphophorus couchianus]
MIASLSRGSLLDEVLHGGYNEQQLAAYVSWVNSQLKRKLGLQPIGDLRRDLQDGVVLVQLIEIVAGEVLQGVYTPSLNKEESRKNVEEVLKFISSRNIRMPRISAKDIVDGNLKSIMRIILALAAHFKPSASQRAAALGGRSLTRGNTTHNPLSTVALAQGAAAALASARLDASLPIRFARINSGWGLDGKRSICVRALVQQYERGVTDEQENPHLGSLSSVTPLPSPRSQQSSNSDRQAHDSLQQEQESSVESSNAVVQMALEDSLSETLEKEVQETRKMVSALQSLLLHGSLPEDEQDVSLTLEPVNTEQQLITLLFPEPFEYVRACIVTRSRLDQSMEEVTELKRELLLCKQEIRNLQAVKEAQQQRLCTQEASILQMKQELLRASMTKDELNIHHAELKWKLEECNRLWGECKQKDVGQKDRLLQQFKHKLEESQKLQAEAQRELEHKNDMLQELMSRNLQEIPVSAENNGYSYSGNPTPSVSGGRGKSPRRKGQHTDLDSWTSFQSCQSQNGSPSSTKILYFTGKSPTPSMINIPKRLGEVTLKDVKEAVDREGNYRYHFKALDPEFGTVKEEVFLDGAIVPGWEGKIVAWLEEDHGDERPL